MSWDMIMKLPIQDRRTLIQKHNKEQEEISKIHDNDYNASNRKIEGEALNTYAKLEQSNQKRRG